MPAVLLEATNTGILRVDYVVWEENPRFTWMPTQYVEDKPRAHN